MLLTEGYRKQLKELHKTKHSFGNGSHRYRDKIERLGYSDVLDYGCGKGSLGLGRKYDPAIPEYAAEPEPADLVVCTDVLEHIEPECLDTVLRHIHSKTRKCAFFVIALRKAKKTLPDGRNAHLIVEPPDWWREQLERFFDLEHCSESEVFEVTAKPL